jgi:hypothetical protein
MTDQGTHLSMMQLDTLLTILSLDIIIILYINRKEMDMLSLQTRFLEPY